MYVCQVSCFYAFALRRCYEEENGGKNCPPAAGGWRGDSAAAGLMLYKRTNWYYCLYILLSQNKSRNIGTDNF